MLTDYDYELFFIGSYSIGISLNYKEEVDVFICRGDYGRHIYLPRETELKDAKLAAINFILDEVNKIKDECEKLIKENLPCSPTTFTKIEQ